MGAPTANQSPPGQTAPKPTGQPTAKTPAGAEVIEVIGGDDNTHGKTIAEVQKEAGEAGGGQPKTPASKGPEVPDTKKAFEALAAVGSLQEQLL